MLSRDRPGYHVETSLPWIREESRRPGKKQSRCFWCKVLSWGGSRERGGSGQAESTLDMALTELADGGRWV